MDIEHRQVPSSSSVAQVWATDLSTNRSLVNTPSTRWRSASVSAFGGVDRAAGSRAGRGALTR